MVVPLSFAGEGGRKVSKHPVYTETHKHTIYILTLTTSLFLFN